MKNHIENYITKLNIFAPRIVSKIGVYERMMEFESFKKYFSDISRIIINIIDSKNDAYWVKIYIFDIVSLEISVIANTNHFFLQMHAYGILIGTLQARYDSLDENFFPNNIREYTKNKTIHLIELMRFRSLIQIKGDEETIRIKRITYGLALVEVVISEITSLFCNNMFSKWQENSKPFEEIIEFSNYLKAYLIKKDNLLQLDDLYCLLVYIIGIYSLLVNSKQFMTSEARIDPKKINDIKSSYVEHYSNMLDGSIEEIIKKLDESLNIINAKLFNSFYVWDNTNRDKEDVTFKFIVGLIVVIDIKNKDKHVNMKNEFQIMTNSKMRNLTIDKDKILDAIHKTINTWPYSVDMKNILNEYLDKNKH